MRALCLATVALAACGRVPSSGGASADAAAILPDGAVSLPVDGALPASAPDGAAALVDAPSPVPGTDAAGSPRDGAAEAAVRADAGAAPDAPVSPDAGARWSPRPGTTWQWQLTGAIDTSLDVQMYDVDLFEAPQATIDALRAAGRTVICYFSAGSHEDFRSDAGMFPAAAIGRPLDGWPGERWLDVRNLEVRAIMKQRLDRAVARRCDGVEPDNVDGYTNQPGFPLTAADQLDYNRFLAREAHARRLSIGLKNDLDQVPELEPDFDWALNEQCLEYDECDLLAPFIAAGKAVFHVEYGDAAKAQTVCPRTKPLGFSTLIKKLSLDAWRSACP